VVTKAKSSHQPSRLTALSAVFVENRSFLKKFLTRFLSQQHDIEDIVQETYLRAYLAEQKKGAKIEQPKAFLFKIARNIALNELTSKARKVTDFIEDCDDRVVIQSGNSIEAELVARQHIELYWESLASLPDQCRRVCMLRKVDGLSYKEIAQRLDLSISSVEKHLMKGMMASKNYIRQKEGVENDGIPQGDGVGRDFQHKTARQEKELG